MLRLLAVAVLLFAALASGSAQAQDQKSDAVACSDPDSLGRLGWCWSVKGSVEAGVALDIADGELFATLISAPGTVLVNHGIDKNVSAVVTRLASEAHIVMSTEAMTEWGLASSVIDIALSRDTTQSAAIEQAYVRFGAITVGLAPSIFNFATGYTHTDGIGSDQRVTQFAAEWGIGPASLAVALEDAETRSAVSDTWGKRGDTTWPDIVVRARVFSDYGLFQAMAAVRELSPAEPDVAPRTGYALAGGVELRVDNLVPGAKILASGVISKGALTYSGASDFVTDFFVDDGALHSTEASSYLLSALVPVGTKSSVTASFSRQSTKTEGPDLTWWTETLIASATANTVLVPGLLSGLDVSYIRDETRDRTLGLDGARYAGERIVVTGFLTRRF